MTISQADLPHDDSGMLPAGIWRAVLRDPITDGFAGMSFEQGVSAPMAGRSLWKLVIAMPVVGALRVEGEPCELGDVSRLREDGAVAVLEETRAARSRANAAVLAPEPAPEPVFVELAPEQPKVVHAELSMPETMADIAKLDEKSAREVAAKLGNLDTTLRLPRLRRFIAEELGLS
jgi:hypothetical protein